MKQFIFYLLVLLLGLILGYKYALHSVRELLLPRNSYTISRSGSADMKLTDPLIDCEQYEQPAIIASNALRGKVKSAIDRIKKPGSFVAVYFRDLKNGPWFGLNEKEMFDPASLLKVPVLIAYLKKAETYPTLFTDEYVFKGGDVTEKNTNLPAERMLKLNEKYTVDTLLKNMIEYSDNTSFQLLVDNIEPKYIKKIHEELDIPYPDINTPNNYISVRNYAGLFRILYNATYLSRDMSEKALTYLLNSQFNKGIRAGLPPHFPAALKFGVRNVSANEKVAQLHECGIVYAQKNPYILCMMTRNLLMKDSIDMLKEISSTVYNEVNITQ